MATAERRMRLANGATVRVRFAGKSVIGVDHGRLNQGNQDKFTMVAGGRFGWLWRLTGWFLFTVADGMGGMAGGAAASGLATQTVNDQASKKLGRRPRISLAAAKDWFLEVALPAARLAIQARIDREPALEKMSTTFEAVLLLPEGILSCHLGDSRTYLYRNGIVRQLTKDHNVETEGTDSEKMLMALRGVTPRAVLTRRLSFPGRGGQPDFHTESIQPGDRILLGSDGIEALVLQALAERLRESDNPELIAARIVADAQAAGARDDITALVVVVL